MVEAAKLIASIGWQANELVFCAILYSNEMG